MKAHLYQKLIDAVNILTARYNYIMEIGSPIYQNGGWVIRITVAVTLVNTPTWQFFYVAGGEIKNRSFENLCLLLDERVQECLLEAAKHRHDPALIAGVTATQIEAARNEGWCDGYDTAFKVGADDFKMQARMLFEGNQMHKFNELLRKPLK